MINRNASLAINQLLQDARGLPAGAEQQFQINLAYAEGLACYAMYSTDIDYKQHELIKQRIAVVRESRLALLKCGPGRSYEAAGRQSEPNAGSASHPAPAHAG